MDPSCTTPAEEGDGKQGRKNNGPLIRQVLGIHTCLLTHDISWVPIQREVCVVLLQCAVCWSICRVCMYVCMYVRTYMITHSSASALVAQTGSVLRSAHTIGVVLVWSHADFRSPVSWVGDPVDG